MKCRDLHCHDNGYLSDGQCLQDDNTPHRLCYSVFIRMSPVGGQSFPAIDKVSTVGLLATIYKFTGNLSEIIDYQAWFVETFDKNETHVQFIIVNFLLSDLFINDDIIKSFNTGTYRIFFSSVHINDFYARVAFEFVLYNELMDYSQMDANLDEFGFEYIFSEHSGERKCLLNDIVPFTKLTFCPFIKIRFDELAAEVLEHNQGVYIPETNTTLSKMEYEIQSDQLHICLSDYEQIYKRLLLRNIDSEASVGKIHGTDNIATKEYVTFFCICLSVVCLLVNIITYSVLSELQSQPGVNNIILCSFLLLAQSFYQFGAGQRSLSHWACSLIGAICHFLWLAAMFSMNVCSIQLFITFTKSRLILPGFKWKQTLLNILYCVVGSLIFVGINIVVSLVQSEGIDTGYGGGLCYLSSSLMHLITFLVPTAVLLISNIVMFTMVVCKIKRITTAAANFREEKNIFPSLCQVVNYNWFDLDIWLCADNCQT